MNPSSIIDLLSELRSRNVVLSIEGDRLRVNAPPGVMTAVLRSEIAGHRDEIFQLLQQDSAASQPDLPRIPRVPRNAPLPLSFAQQRLWVLGQMDGASDAYNVPWIFHLKGVLEVQVLRRALDRVMARHEALRTTFAMSNGEPVQQIAQDCRFPLVEHDLQSNSQDGAALENLIRAEAAAPFDLEHGPIVRGRLIRLRHQEYLLVLCVHHIAVDGWSMALLARELGQLYSAFLRGDGDPLPELEIQYADYAVWQRKWMQGRQQQEQAEYWKAALADAPTLLELPRDHPRPAMQDHARGFEELVLDEELTCGLKKFSAGHRATLFMAIIAAWATLMARLTGREDLLIGYPVANRGRRELEDVIGFFANTLVIRLNFSGSPTVRDLVAQTRMRCLEALKNQDLPFEKMVEFTHAARSLSFSPLVQVMFAWQNTDHALLEMEGVEVKPVQGERTKAKFDLLLELQETDGKLTGGIEFAASLFERSTIQRYIAYFRTLLCSMIADDTQTIDRLPLMPESERRQILEEFAVARADYPKDKCVQQLFEELAAGTPDAVAIECSGKQLTYGALNQRANQLAHYLRELGVKPGARVAVCVERNFEMLVALLATLKAGGAYVPLDPAYPAERLQFMLQDSAPEALLTQRSLQHIFAEARHSIPLLDLMDERGAWKNRPVANPQIAAIDLTPDNIAYVIYTSGSTGQPKGVMVPHRGIVRLVRGANYATMSAEDRFLQMAPVSFDAATLEIWGALLNGATLILLPGEKPSGEEIIRTIQEQRISFLWLTTPLFNLLVDANLEALGSVRQVLTGGDTASPSHMRRFTAQLGNGHSLVNAYGPTENTTFTTCYRMTQPHHWSGSVPIGRPVSNSTVYILDRLGQPVPVGVPGELYAGGDGVALGYQHRPELTAEKFLPDPFCSEPHARMYRTGDVARWLPDGNVEFLGRNDSQVKIRGFRVELGEIEARLAEYPGIKSAVVVCREHSPGDKRLVAYYTVPNHSESAQRWIRSEDLRAYLSSRLPDYLVPSAYFRMGALPLTPAGKVDRRALIANDGHTPATRQDEPSQEETETRIALPVLSESEQRLLAMERNLTEMEYPRDVPLAALVEQQVAKTPDATAVIFGSESMTYRELNQRANQLARELVKHGAGPEQLVGIFVERSLDMLVALLAVVKSGAGYVPLDTYFPAARLQYMIGDSGLRLIVTHDELVSASPWFSGHLILLGDRAWRANSSDNLHAAAKPGDRACIFYTSGSTGSPTGVEITYDALINALWSVNELWQLNAADRLLAITPISLATAGVDIWMPWIAGATTILASREAASDAIQLMALLQKHDITLLQARTVTWRLLLGAGWEGKSNLQAGCTGEAMPPEFVDILRPIVRRLWNLYGATETTLWCTAHLVQAGERPVAIGRPLGNQQCYILNGQRQLVPSGAVGELYIAGAGLARGYLNQPSLTDEKFVRNPFSRNPGERMFRTGDLARYLPDGNIECLGRTDRQVKIRAHRIELREIESRLAEHPAIQQAVVMARESTPGDKILVAYYTTVENLPSHQPLTARDLREHLLASLLEYMIPAAYVHMDSLPLTPAGEIDRKALPEPEGDAHALGEYDPPQDELESQIAAIWAELLELDRVGRNDNFFEIGGHSLLAVQLVLKLRTVLSGASFPLNAILEAPTVKGLAARIRDHQRNGEYPVLVQLRPGSNGKTPFFCVHASDGTAVGMRPLAMRMNSGRAFYCLQAKGLDGSEHFTSVEEAARFYLNEVRKVQTHGPYYLGGYCFGGLVALEMARMLSQAGERVESLILLDSLNPAYLRSSPPVEMLRRLLGFCVRRAHMHLRTINSLEQHERMRYLTGRMRAALVHFERYLERVNNSRPAAPSDALTVLSQNQGSDARIDKILAQLRTLGVDLTRKYNPQAYHGDVLLIRVERDDDPYEDHYLGWRPFIAGDLKTIKIQSTHEGILREPAVRSVAVLIDAELRSRDLQQEKELAVMAPRLAPSR